MHLKAVCQPPKKEEEGHACAQTISIHFYGVEKDFSSFLPLHTSIQSYSKFIMDLEGGNYEPGFVGIRFCQEW